MASAASRICAPSCRSRSTRRSAAAASSTASVLVRSSSLTRLGPSRPRISRRSPALTARASHDAPITVAAPRMATRKVPGQLLMLRIPPNARGESAFMGGSEPPAWLRNSSQSTG